MEFTCGMMCRQWQCKVPTRATSCRLQTSPAQPCLSCPCTMCDACLPIAAMRQWTCDTSLWARSLQRAGGQKLQMLSSTLEATTNVDMYNSAWEPGGLVNQQWDVCLSFDWKMCICDSGHDSAFMIQVRFWWPPGVCICLQIFWFIPPVSRLCLWLPI